MTLFSFYFSPLLCSCIQNAEYPPHLSFPQDFFPCSCFFLFSLFLLLCTPCLCLFSTTSAEKSPNKDKKKMGSNNIPSPLHCFNVHGIMPLLMQWSNWHHNNSCGIWQARYVAWATIPNCLLGCWANKMGFLLVSMRVTLARWQWTQVSAIASEALKRNRRGSPVCNIMSSTYKPQSIPQLQPQKIMCTTAVIQDYNNHSARAIVILDSCWKHLWVFLLAWKVYKKEVSIYNTILEEIDCQQQFGRALLTSFRDWEEKFLESISLLKQIKAEDLRAGPIASKFSQKVHLSIWIFCVLKEIHHMLGWLFLTRKVCLIFLGETSFALDMFIDMFHKPQILNWKKKKTTNLLWLYQYCIFFS